MQTKAEFVGATRVWHEGPSASPCQTNEANGVRWNASQEESGGLGHGAVTCPALHELIMNTAASCATRRSSHRSTSTSKSRGPRVVLECRRGATYSRFLERG